MKKSKKILIFLSVLLLLVVVWIGVSVFSTSKGADSHKEALVVRQGASSTLPTMSTAELAKFDGTDPTLPIYIGLDGYVYDVSAGRKFYEPDAVYHYLAGKDSSKSLHIMGGDIIKEKYRIIAVLSH